MTVLTQSGHEQALLDCVEVCAERAWRLAYSLIRNSNDAYDVVQQAFLVAAHKPERIPRRPENPWPWFSVVVLHEAQSARRRIRGAPRALDGEEESMQLIDTRAADPLHRITRDEAHHELWQAIDSLPADERAAIVLTHISGLTHATAAAALNLPRQTLTSQIQRGLERLRGRLRTDDPTLLARLAIVPVALPDGGWGNAVAAWKTTACAGLGESATAGALTAGGGLLLKKGMVFAMVAVALGLGVATGVYVVSPTESRESARAADDAAASRMLAGSAPAAADATGPGDTATAASRMPAPLLAHLASLERDAARLREENAALATEVETLTAELDALAGEGSDWGPVFTFGRFGRLEAVMNANWKEMAEAHAVITAAIRELADYEARGEEAPKRLHLAIQENTEKVRKYEYRVVDQLPSAAKYNGELTHPISVTNLLASHLRSAGVPLGAEQVARIALLGEAFEEDYAALEERHPAGTLRARKLLEEYLLKGDFTDELFAMLTPEQRKVVVDPRSNRVAFMDLYCPSLMIVHTSPIITGASLDEIRGKLAKLLGKRYTLEESLGARLEPILDRWSAAVVELLTPVPQHSVRFYSFEQSVVAGGATVELLTTMLETLDLTEASRAAILDDPGFFIPRVVAPANQG